MSIIVKGVDMPESCRDCPLNTYYLNNGETRCRATNATLAENYKTISFDGRPECCPLVEIETPHGPLIDEDRIYDECGNRITLEWLDRVTVMEGEG